MDKNTMQMFNDAKSASTFINKTVKSYRNVWGDLHIAACVAFYHAAEHGDPRYLNAIFGDVDDKDGLKSGLRTNDKTAFRTWLGKHSTVIILSEDGNPKLNEAGEPMSKTWLGFRQKMAKDGTKPGFYVKTGMESDRKGKYNPEELLALEPFFQNDVSKQKPITLEAILAYLAKVQKHVNDKVQKAEEEDQTKINLPKDIVSNLESLTAAVGKYVGKSAGTTAH